MSREHGPTSLSITTLRLLRRRAACAALLSVFLSQPAFSEGASTSLPDSTATFWRDRMFFIPYQPNMRSPLGPIAKIQLFVMRDGAREWTPLQEAAPNVRGFSYHAPADGMYAFSVVLSDRQGNTWPKGPPEPQLLVIVDTQAPTLKIEASYDVAGNVVVRYEAVDLQLRLETLRLEAQVDNLPWQPISIGPPEVSHPDRILGQVTWNPPIGARTIRVRGNIDDRAGNQATATALPNSVPQTMSSITAEQPMPPLAAAYPDALTPHASAPPTIDWPANNDFHATQTPPVSSSAQRDSFQTANPYATVPPLQNPYTLAGSAPMTAAIDGRTPAQLTADVSPISAAPNGANANSVSAPSLLSSDWPSGLSSDGGWTTASDPSDQVPLAAEGSPKWINSLTVDIDYDLHSAGPWGVAKVELWATGNGGQSWTSLGVDADNASPFRATLPGVGVYGLRIVVEGVNGTPVGPPKAGDNPELTLGVDLQPPSVKVLGAQLGQGNDADQLLIRWTAEDEHLTTRPAALFFSDRADGPWSTIAENLENTGEFRWRMTRQPPKQLFIRAEVRDAAGNVGTHQSLPITLDLPQPTGRVRGVRPATSDAERYRTANGRT